MSEVWILSSSRFVGPEVGLARISFSVRGSNPCGRRAGLVDCEFTMFVLGFVFGPWEETPILSGISDRPRNLPGVRQAVDAGLGWLVTCTWGTHGGSY